MWYASGNRDEEVHGNPHDFDVTLSNSPRVPCSSTAPWHD